MAQPAFLTRTAVTGTRYSYVSYNRWVLKFDKPIHTHYELNTQQLLSNRTECSKLDFLLEKGWAQQYSRSNNDSWVYHFRVNISPPFLLPVFSLYRCRLAVGVLYQPVLLLYEPASGVNDEPGAYVYLVLARTSWRNTSVTMCGNVLSVISPYREPYDFIFPIM